MSTVAEAAMKVTDKAGDHHVEGATLLLAQGLDGISQSNDIMILGSGM